MDEKNSDSNELNFKNFSAVKEQVSKIIQQIEEDKQKYESSFENKTQHITLLEFKLMEKFDAETQERKDMERRLVSLVDDRFSILRNELNKEGRNRNESVENFTFYLEVGLKYIIILFSSIYFKRNKTENLYLMKLLNV